MQIIPDEQRFVEGIVKRVLGEGLIALWLIGSRARDRARRGSDLDLLVQAKAPLTLDQRTQLSTAFEESDLPFHVDVVDAAAIDEPTRERMLVGAVVWVLAKTSATE